MVFGYQRWDRLPVDRRGFTLIELMIVVVIIGILAAVAVPKFSATKGNAYVATMQTDLKNLVTAQEGYYYENGAYYSGAVPDAALPYSVSDNVGITILSADIGGFSATAAYVGITDVCAVFVGSAAPPAPATTEGSPACN